MSADQFATQAWSKAELHLVEAAAQRADVAPGAMVHLAYYAMFHAARAALLRGTGSSPKKHAGVIRQFGLVAKDRGAAMRSAGENLSDIQDRRIRADYRETACIAVQEAQDAFRKAQEFPDICASEFGFPRERSPENG